MKITGQDLGTMSIITAIEACYNEAYEKIARQWCERHKIDLVE